MTGQQTQDSLSSLAKESKKLAPEISEPNLEILGCFKEF